MMRLPAVAVAFGVAGIVAGPFTTVLQDTL
jgi:hypothetical protein